MLVFTCYHLLKDMLNISFILFFKNIFQMLINLLKIYYNHFVIYIVYKLFWIIQVHLLNLVKLHKNN